MNVFETHTHTHSGEQEKDGNRAEMLKVSSFLSASVRIKLKTAAEHKISLRNKHTYSVLTIFKVYIFKTLFADNII